MFIVNAAVEQFGTLIDQKLCDLQPTLIRLRHDDRLLCILRDLSNQVPELVHWSRLDQKRISITTAAPGPSLLALIGPVVKSLPDRIITIRGNKVLRGISVREVAHMRCDTQKILNEQLVDCLSILRASFDPVCRGFAKVDHWDDDGVMVLHATDSGAIEFDIPIATEIVSALGDHRRLSDEYKGSAA